METKRYYYKNLNNNDIFVIITFSQTLKNDKSFVENPYNLKNKWINNVYSSFLKNDKHNFNPIKLACASRKFWKYLVEYERLDRNFLLKASNNDYSFLAERYDTILEYKIQAKQF